VSAFYSQNQTVGEDDSQSRLKWHELNVLAEQYQHTRLTELFRHHPHRARHLSLSHEGLFVDFSKQFVDDTVLQTLYQLAELQGLDQHLSRLYQGWSVNRSEDQPALHTTLRAPQKPESFKHPEAYHLIHTQYQRMVRFVQAVHAGELTGATDQAFTDVVNIGIGGSDLGPRLVVEALGATQQPKLNVHFASSADGAELRSILARVNPQTTLFLVVSKSFTTQETMFNAEWARNWLEQRLSGHKAWREHMVGISAHSPNMEHFGIQSSYQFMFSQWVGGRFSLWSTAGMAIALGYGRHCFDELLQGAHAMDQHCLYTSWRHNIPITLGLIDVWNTNFLKSSTHAVIPYSYYLQQLPAYLQQLFMESNGKSITQQGSEVTYDTQSIVWGDLGTNAQHAFFQLLHQGTHWLPVEFLAIQPATSSDSEMIPISHAVAQAQALMEGASALEGEPYKHYPGNKPSTFFKLDRLHPKTLGQLIACYEHRVWVQSVIWRINAFDQWGVELGKKLSQKVLARLKGEQQSTQSFKADDSTEQLIQLIGNNKRLI